MLFLIKLIVLLFSAGECDEFKLLASIPSWFNSSTWSFINDMRGEITKVSPSKSNAGNWYNNDFPEPVGITVNTFFLFKIDKIMFS